VVGLAWSNEPKSYAGGSVMLPAGPPMPDRSRLMTHKKGYPGPPGWGLGAGLTTLPCKN